VIRELRANTRFARVPILVITGLADPPAEVNAAAVEVFIKPFDLGRLGDSLQRAVVPPAAELGSTPAPSCARRVARLAWRAAMAILPAAAARLAALIRAVIGIYFRLLWPRSGGRIRAHLLPPPAPRATASPRS
jgi:hypothetical protein